MCTLNTFLALSIQAIFSRRKWRITPTSEFHQLTAYCDANWGGQFGSAVEDGTPLELFKFRSLSGFLICRSGGPIAWKSIRQNQTALRSCEAEITATNKCATELQSIRHRANNIGIPESYPHAKIYNEKKAAVQWASSVTSKGTKHRNLRENMIRECHQSKDVHVEHIPSIINTSNIFTKEMKDNTHFRILRDSLVVSLQAFLKYNHNVPSNIISANKILPYYSIRLKKIVPESLELISVIRQTV